MSTTASSFSTVGESYGGFRVTRKLEIEELRATLIELEHLASGAQVMHLANEDPENLFCLSFQTTPQTSNGVAHILEHTVLCGSRKFPVKDPFFTMIRRSLNTFMNALTGSDFTCYPAASQVPKDFYNLLEVYIDAAFHPNLKQLSFLQEGHRLEFEDGSDSSTPLQYKGVVFNEMKGALTSPETRLWEALYSGLFPDLTYGINSGGDPKVIPDLSYEELLDFHKTHYHPSRCLFFFYGNMPLEKHLDFIDEHALSGVERLEPLPPIPPQKRHEKPVYIESSYPIDADQMAENKSLVAMGWLTCSVSEQKEILALSILETALMGTDASPLKRALMKSGLCKQALTFMDDEISEVPILYLMKGCKADDADKIEKLVLDTLQGFVNDGIPNRLIESALHQVEIHRTEITGDGAPFGLTLFMRSALLRQHNVAPERGLQIHSLFEELHEDFQRPEFLSQLIQKHFIDNPHRVRVVMRPDPELSAKENQAEREKLDEIRNKLSEEKVAEIVKQAEALEAFQTDSEETDIDVLPKVTIADVPKEPHDYPLQRESIGNADIFFHNTFTNHMSYVDLCYDLPALTEEQLPTARIFASLLGHLGCGDRSFAEVLEFEQENIGAVDAALSLNIQADNHLLFKPSLHIKGRALQRKTDELFTIMRELLLSPKFTEMDRLKELMVKRHSMIESAFTHKALKYAINQSASCLTPALFTSSRWFGLPFYWELHRIVENWDSEGPKLVERLEEMRDLLADPERLQIVITSDDAGYKQIQDAQFYGLTERTTKPHTPWSCDFNVEPIQDQARTIAAPVAFNAHAFISCPYSNPDSAGLSLASFILDNKVLHKAIREKGGAYGGGSSYSPLTGKFYFFSYRDPNIARTIAAWQNSVERIANGDFEDRYLDEAKLEMIQAVDTPIAPGSCGATAFAWYQAGLKIDMRQKFRDRLLNMTREGVQNAIKHQLIPNMSKGAVVSFAGKALVEKENLVLKAAGATPLAVKSII